MNKTTSTVFDLKLSENKRPHSQNELNFIKTKTFNLLRLGTTQAYHEDCDHSYLVKKNGRKEKEITENGNSGNCSICWRLSKTPSGFQERAFDLIRSFYNIRQGDYLYYEDITTEIEFYNWLYIG